MDIYAGANSVQETPSFKRYPFSQCDFYEMPKYDNFLTSGERDEENVYIIKWLSKRTTRILRNKKEKTE